MRGPRRFTPEERHEVWDRIGAGESVNAIALSLGRYPSAIRQIQLVTGGVRPGVRRRSARALSLVEREEISRGVAGGQSLRAIAARLGRAPSTVSREVARHGGRSEYRACVSDRRAQRRTRRPKRAKLAVCRRLAMVVEAKLELKWSPQQISQWLPGAFPEDLEMRVSHETIYLSLYVQGRGALRRELHHALRSGRAIRRAKKSLPNGQGQIPNMVLISQRPAEVGDRAVPGHWEGDLIMGRGKTCIGTLVERSTRYVMLLKLEHNTAEQVRLAMGHKILQLPDELRRSITWDQGKDVPARRVHHRNRRPGLLLRPTKPVAARHE